MFENQVSGSGEGWWILGSVNPVAPTGESAEPVCYIENTNLGFWLKSLSAV